jgi:uncharacterized damage-inducible protein DinB
MESRTALAHYLHEAREALLWKLDGLSERELRLPRTPTGTNLLGLVKHCAIMEHGYFGDSLGRDPGVAVPVYDYDEDPNADLYATADEPAASIIELYRRVGAYVDATLAELPLDAPARVPWWGDRGETTLGRLIVHVLGDVARHTGQADIIRESIDGAAGHQEARAFVNPPADGWSAHVRRLTEIADRFA